MIGNVVRNKIPEGPFTRKRLTQPSSEKFTPQNLLYCQQFIDTVSSLQPEKLKFFDEAGVHCGIGNPVYGHSLKGTPAIKVMRGNLKGANITLSLLCGLEGVLYTNTVDGASDSKNFFKLLWRSRSSYNCKWKHGFRIWRLHNSRQLRHSSIRKWRYFAKMVNADGRIYY